MSASEMNRLAQASLKYPVEINKKTFCAAPWFQIRTDNLGDYRSCCVIQHEKSNFPDRKDYKWPEHTPDQWLSSDYVKYLRQSLTQGKQLPECESCWQSEKYGRRSLRQITNDHVTRNKGHTLDQTWLAAYFKHKTDWDSQLLLSVDIKLTNICNYACAMCYPHDSSQIYTIWSQNTTHPIVSRHLDKEPNYLNQVKDVFVEKNNHQLLKDLLERRPKFIKILGGEPLLDRVTLQILSSVPDEQKNRTSLLFVTNGSVDFNETLSMLGNYQNVFFVLSLEGIGAVQDWVRRGSNWNSIQNNVDKYIQKNGTARLHVHHTLQALTVYHLPNLMSWIDCKNLTVSINVLADPAYFSLSAIPDALRAQVIDRIQNLCDRQHRSSDVLELEQIDMNGVLRLLTDSTNCVADTADLKSFVEWYDRDRQFPTVFPEWVDFLT